MKITPPHYKLEKPKVEGIKIDIIKGLDTSFKEFLEKANEPQYLYWNKIKYKEMPKGISVEQGWILIRGVRKFMAKNTPIKAENGNYFEWIKLPSFDEYLHYIDMYAGGQIFPQPSIQSQQNQVLVARGIIEEAIASSQLEGAHTTRSAAKKMILENRKPKSTDEKMIMNNYQTICDINERHKNQELSKALLFEIHSTITRDTVAREEQNRFRKNRDDIVVQGSIGKEVYITHVPPKEVFLGQEIGRLIEFANNDSANEFIHPVTKAIFIHFWIGYLHPFTDGNGRLARAIFYWYLLKKGYWTMMYLPISTMLKKSPVQYAKAYIYSEQDDLDLTYFYDFHIRKIRQSLDEFKDYIQQISSVTKNIERKLKDIIILNNRQLLLIQHLLSDELASTTITSHVKLHDISRPTATQDFKILQKAGLIEKKRVGKYIKYYASAKLRSVISA